MCTYPHRYSLQASLLLAVGADTRAEAPRAAVRTQSRQSKPAGHALLTAPPRHAHLDTETHPSLSHTHLHTYTHTHARLAVPCTHTFRRADSHTLPAWRCRTLRWILSGRSRMLGMLGNRGDQGHSGHMIGQRSPLCTDTAHWSADTEGRSFQPPCSRTAEETPGC